MVTDRIRRGTMLTFIHACDPELAHRHLDHLSNGRITSPGLAPSIASLSRRRETEIRKRAEWMTAASYPHCLWKGQPSTMTASTHVRETSPRPAAPAATTHPTAAGVWPRMEPCAGVRHDGTSTRAAPRLSPKPVPGSRPTAPPQPRSNTSSKAKHPVTTAPPNAPSSNRGNRPAQPGTTRACGKCPTRPRDSTPSSRASATARPVVNRRER
jgi:hypothetical protein